jgi:hypothetical protein
VPRSSVREELQRRLREYLAVAEEHSPDRFPLNVRSVSGALGVSPTTFYKYGFNQQINAAERRQRERGHLSASTIEHQGLKNQIRALAEELERERERSKGLAGLIAIMESNAGRLGFDPEEMYKPILRPIRTISHAGQKGAAPFRRGSRTIG